MKYQFSKSISFVPEWNNNKSLPEEEQVTMTLSVLSMGHVLELMSVIEGSATAGQVDSETLDAGTTARLVEHARKIMPQYITDFVNLDGPDGPIAVSDVCEYPQFLGLIIEVMFQLITISSPSEQDSKN